MNTRPFSSRPTLGFAGTFLGVLVTFRVLDVVIGRLGQRPVIAFNEVGRWWHVLTSRVPWWLPVAAVVLVAILLVLDAYVFRSAVRQRIDPLFAEWNAIDDGTALRWFVVGVTAIPAWALSCYARNLYFDQLQVADRLLIVALWIAIAWRPLFVLPFSLAAAGMAGQFIIPLGFISWTEMGVLLRFPVLVAAFWIVRSIMRSRRSDVFIFAWVCVVAATYWASGLGKVRVGWLTHPHVHLLLLGAYANGWLAYLEPAVVERAARVVALLAWPFMLFTLVVECGSLFVLWRRWSLIAFFGLAAAFHLGAFAMTGIFFWKWVLADAMLLVFLLRGRRLARLPIFTPGLFALSVVAILTSSLWTPSENLTWFDTPLTYALEFEGVDAGGASYALPAGFFRPYSDAIVLGVAGATPPHPKLTRGMGVTMDRSLAAALEAAHAPDSVFAIEQSRGTVRLDSAASAALDAFVGTYAANARCATERDPAMLRVLGVPRHLWTFPLDANLPCGVRLERVRVFERTTFFDGARLRPIRRLLLREIPAKR